MSVDLSKGAANVFSKSIPVTETGCWLFTGMWDANGYGKIGFKGKDWLAHRLMVGAVDPKICVCHKCDTPACVNPEHLFLGSHADNMRDMRRKSRGRGLSAKGVKHPMAVLDENRVRSIFFAAGTNREIARKYSISQSNVSAIKRGAIWRHLKLWEV